MSIAGVDQDETNRLQGLMDRKEKEEAGNRKIREASNSKHTQSGDPNDSIVEDENDNNKDFNLNIRKKSGQNRLKLT